MKMAHLKPVRDYVKRVASMDLEEYPEWDITAPLPTLPVPDLSATCSTYLQCIRAIVSEEQYARTKVLVDQFQKENGEGRLLQDKLIETAIAKTNWSYDWWLADMYMKVRLPLPINSNPGMVFPRQQFENQDHQLRYAARLISGILDYKVIIDSHSMPIDRARHRKKGQPLCMEQCYRLFTTYRVPGIPMDQLMTSTKQTQNKSDHILVMCRNQCFLLDVQLNGSRLSEENLCSQLKRIVRSADIGKTDAFPAGILTSMDRTQWANTRNKLLTDESNKVSLQLIEQCIFVLCLDKSIPLKFNHQKSIDETNMNLRDDVSLALQMLHGQGSGVNSANRWYDKTMQFIICEDGACGLNYEHSPSEGIAVVQLVEHLLKYMEEVRVRTLVRIQSLCELSEPQKLTWTIQDDIMNDTLGAMRRFDSAIGELDFYVLKFEDFGKGFVKSQNMSPDSFIQLALQLTYYKVYGHLVSTYESASTRRFKEGRVDNIRACTQEALEWVRAMVGDNKATDEQKLQFFKTAMEHQTEILIATILGHGIDCHLLGLKELAIELGHPVPEVFVDESYQIINHFTLSTSQVPTTTDAFMCYGPVVPNGYGVCYNPQENSIIFCISSFKHCDETKSDMFASSLESGLNQIRDMCCRNSLDCIENNTRNSPRKYKLSRQSQIQHST